MKFWNRAWPVLAGIAALALAACTPAKPNDPAVADWYTDPDAATAAAMQKHRPIFIAFLATDWSTASQGAVKDVLNTRAFKQYADANLVLLKVDFSRKGLSPEMQKTYDELATSLQLEHFPEFMMADPYHHVGKFSTIGTYGIGGPMEFVGQIHDILETWNNIVATRLPEIQAQSQANAQAQAKAQTAAAAQAATQGGVVGLPSPAELFNHNQAVPAGVAPAIPSPTPGAMPLQVAPTPGAAPAGDTSLPPIKLN
jgi:protein disulfide-isomerase